MEHFCRFLSLFCRLSKRSLSLLGRNTLAFLGGPDAFSKGDILQSDSNLLLRAPLLRLPPNSPLMRSEYALGVDAGLIGPNVEADMPNPGDDRLADPRLRELMRDPKSKGAQEVQSRVRRKVRYAGDKSGAKAFDRSGKAVKVAFKRGLK